MSEASDNLFVSLSLSQLLYISLPCPATQRSICHGWVPTPTNFSTSERSVTSQATAQPGTASVDWVKELLMGSCGFCVLLTNQRNSIWQGHYRSQGSGLKPQVDTWDGHKCWKCQQSKSRNTPASQDNGSSLSLSLPVSHFLADETNVTSVSFDKSLTSPSVKNRDLHPNLFDLCNWHNLHLSL